MTDSDGNNNNNIVVILLIVSVILCCAINYAVKVYMDSSSDSESGYPLGVTDLLDTNQDAQ